MTTSDFARNPDNYCYRHPDRQSFVLCQRCLRTVCPECQTQGAVGVICPECLKEQQKATPPAVKKAQRRWASARPMAAVGSAPRVTTWIVGITFAMYLVQLIPGLGASIQTTLMMYAPALYPELTGVFQPWRLLTVLVVHSSFWHVGLNLLALWMLGQSLEPLIGHRRFLWLYLLSGLGGSVAIALFGFGTPVVGASGAIFGLFGALLVIGRHIGANIQGIVVVLGINLAITFLPMLLGQGSAVSWQAHIGGLAVGALVGGIFARTRQPSQQRSQTAFLVLTAVFLIALLVIPAFIWHA